MTAARPMPIPDAARQFIDGICNFDIDQVAAGLADDARLSVTSEPYATGRTGVRSALVRVLGSVYSIRCEPAAVWVRPDIAIIEADVECERLDRSRLAFPLTVVLRFRDDLIAEIRLLTYAPALIGSLGSLGKY